MAAQLWTYAHYEEHPPWLTSLLEFIEEGQVEEVKENAKEAAGGDEDWKEKKLD